MTEITSKHLNREQQIQLGSYFTPKKLVDMVYDFINPYLGKQDKTIILDNAAGFGAFLSEADGLDYRAADFDIEAYNFLKNEYQPDKIFYCNSLKNVSRQSFNIPDKIDLIIVGNPPYNDTTSVYMNGKKGKNDCDEDLFDRDLGVSFLKSYNKLGANVICILHPLSYLIKESNFNRLRIFKDNYNLKKGLLFSSAMFAGTGSTKFPIVIALYERDDEGMNYDYIRNFKFDILDSHDKFILSHYQTTDGLINKYPPRTYDNQVSDLGLYYYTFRDINSLKRSKGFFSDYHYNGIVVNLDNFYQYAYLHSFKRLFKPDNLWLYGNLSPLVRKDFLENSRPIFVEYALQTNQILKNLPEQKQNLIRSYYLLKQKNASQVDYLEKVIIEEMNHLLEFKRIKKPDIVQIKTVLTQSRMTFAY